MDAAAVINFYALAKSRKCPRIVIPAKTGIQRFLHVIRTLDAGIHRCDDLFYEGINFIKA